MLNKVHPLDEFGPVSTTSHCASRTSCASTENPWKQRRLSDDDRPSNASKNPRVLRWVGNVWIHGAVMQHEFDIAPADHSAIIGRLINCTAAPYLPPMFTVVETPTFACLARDYWDGEDRTSFVTFIASNPEAGDVVPGSGGLRKIRWGRAGQGKRGGVHVIYYNRFANGEIWLLLIYGKSVKENVTSHVLAQIKEEIGNDKR